MKLFVTGTRGIPDIPGGVERHCEQLYPLISSEGTEVMVARRASYIQNKCNRWRDIELLDLFCSKKKSLEAILHTTVGLFEAKRWGADIVHIHAIGPALMTPLGRLLGMKVVVTNHGPDYDRLKWGVLAKKVLRLGEYIGCKYANEVIVISETIKDIVWQRCGRESHLIYNGVPTPQLCQESDYIESLGLVKDRYLLVVARLVPEKGLDYLMDAYEDMESNFKLVIAGDSDYEDHYSLELKHRSTQNENIIMPGYVRGENLAQLFTHARLFVLPSYHEGLPISLLEALSYGLRVVVSDIPANIEANLDPHSYFRVGDISDLRRAMVQGLSNEISSVEREQIRMDVTRKYNWVTIAGQTMRVYEKVMKHGLISKKADNGY